LQAEIYPNPSDDYNELIITSSQSIDASIDLHDMLGRKIKPIFQGKLRSGKNNYTIPIEDLRQGMYFYKVQTSRGNLSIKFIKT